MRLCSIVPQLESIQLLAASPLWIAELDQLHAGRSFGKIVLQVHSLMHRNNCTELVAQSRLLKNTTKALVDQLLSNRPLADAAYLSSMPDFG